MDAQSAILKIDPETDQILEGLKERWGVSRETAASRAIRMAAPTAGNGQPSGKIAAFKELQARLQLTPEKAAGWIEAVESGRR